MSQGWTPQPVPYVPLPQLYQQPPQPKPSGLYKALGITQLTLGVAGVLYALFGIATMGFVAAYARKLATMDPWTIAYSIAHSSLALLTGAMLAATGFGVMRAKRWARPLGVAYAALSLIETWGAAALSILVLQPRMYARVHISPASGMQLFSIVTSALSVLVMSVLPVVTLVALLRARARDELDL